MWKWLRRWRKEIGRGGDGEAGGVDRASTGTDEAGRGWRSGGALKPTVPPRRAGRFVSPSRELFGRRRRRFAGLPLPAQVLRLCDLLWRHIPGNEIKSAGSIGLLLSDRKSTRL